MPNIDDIDRELTRDRFGELDGQTCLMLIEALERDFDNRTARLADAASLGDAQATRRARHALWGLCGAFGATLAAIRNAALAMLRQKARCDIAGQPGPST